MIADKLKPCPFCGSDEIEPRNLTQEAAFLTALAEHGLLSSTGEVLVSGIPSIGVPAGGLTKALNAACSTARREGFDAGREWAAQVAEHVSDVAERAKNTGMQAGALLLAHRIRALDPGIPIPKESQP